MIFFISPKQPDKKMKKCKSFSIILLLLIFSFTACEEKTEPLSDSDIEMVTNEVKEAFERSADAASNHDVDAIMKFLWNDEDLVYAGNGVLIKGWPNLYEVVNSVHSNPQNQGFRLEFDNTYVKVISHDCALVTGAGKFVDFPTEEGPVDKNLTVTFLFEKIDGKWLVTAGHESTPENIF
jgi:uncharacterized protein (TIGR02246 family)